MRSRRLALIAGLIAAVVATSPVSAAGRLGLRYLDSGDPATCIVRVYFSGFDTSPIAYRVDRSDDKAVWTEVVATNVVGISLTSRSSTTHVLTRWQNASAWRYIKVTAYATIDWNADTSTILAEKVAGGCR